MSLIEEVEEVERGYASEIMESVLHGQSMTVESVQLLLGLYRADLLTLLNGNVKVMEAPLPDGVLPIKVDGDSFEIELPTE